VKNRKEKQVLKQLVDLEMKGFFVDLHAQASHGTVKSAETRTDASCFAYLFCFGNKDKDKEASTCQKNEKD